MASMLREEEPGEKATVYEAASKVVDRARKKNCLVVIIIVELLLWLLIITLVLTSARLR